MCACEYVGMWERGRQRNRDAGREYYMIIEKQFKWIYRLNGSMDYGGGKQKGKKSEDWTKIVGVIIIYVIL